MSRLTLRMKRMRWCACQQLVSKILETKTYRLAGRQIIGCHTQDGEHNVNEQNHLEIVGQLQTPSKRPPVNLKQLGRPVWLLVHKMRTLRIRKMSVSSDGIDVDERLVGATDWFLIVSTSPRTRRVLRFFFFFAPNQRRLRRLRPEPWGPCRAYRSSTRAKASPWPPPTRLVVALISPSSQFGLYQQKKKATTFDQIIPHRTFHILCGSSRISGEFPLVPFPFQTNRPLNESRLRVLSITFQEIWFLLIFREVDAGIYRIEFRPVNWFERMQLWTMEGSHTKFPALYHCSGGWREKWSRPHFLEMSRVSTRPSS